MITRQHIVQALLEEDVSNVALARRYGCSTERVRQVRKAAGIAPYRRGRRGSGETWEQAYAARTSTVENGHMRWLGATTALGTPVLRLGSEAKTVYRVAFEAEYGRAPVGNVQPGCELARCVSGRHLTDRQMREDTGR